MRARWKLPTFVAFVIALSATSLPTNAGAPPWPTTPSLGFRSSEALTADVRNTSWITNYSYAEGATSGLYTRVTECESVTDNICKSADSIAVNVVLPPCSSSASDNCIDTLKIATPSKDFLSANLLSERTTKKTPGNSDVGLPAGGGISVWRVQGVNNSLGADTYAVNVHLDLQNYPKQNCGGDPSKCPFILGAFTASVHPIKLAPFVNGSTCLWRDGMECATVGNFPDGARVSLSIKVTNRLTGFLFGRMKNVAIDVKPINKDVNAVEVVADPIDVPSIYAFVEKRELSKYPAIENYWKVRRSNLAASDIASSDTVDLGPWPQYAMNDFKAFETLVKSGPLVTSLWKFGSGGGIGVGSPCFSDKSKLLGMVTTNAPTYDPGPPSFENGTLNYRVGGAHFLEDGTTEFRGTYDLAIRSEFARCLYGFTDAPIKASVSITSTDGTVQNVATESLKTNADKSWLFLSAAGFTFSSPTIRVKLVQETPTTAPVIKKPSAPKVTITCTKGKLVKKVTGATPTCPKGYTVKK